MSTCPQMAELSSFCSCKQPQVRVSMQGIPNAGSVCSIWVFWQTAAYLSVLVSPVWI